MVTLAVAALLGLAAATPVAAATRISLNGSFEQPVGAALDCSASPTDNWAPVAQSGARPGTVVTSPRHDGTHAALVDNEPGNGDVNALNGFSQGFGSLNATKTITLSAWVYPFAGSSELLVQESTGACTSGVKPSPLSVTFEDSEVIADGPDPSTAAYAIGPGLSLGAWHHVTASYNLVTRKVSLKIDAQAKVTSAAGSVTTTVSGPANLFMGVGSVSPDAVDKFAFDTVSLTTDNLVANGSFEQPVGSAVLDCSASPTDNWAPVAQGGARPGTVVTSPHHDGTHAALVDNEPGNGDVDALNGFSQGFGSLNATKTITLSTWVYHFAGQTELELVENTGPCSGGVKPNPINLTIVDATGGGAGVLAFGPDPTVFASGSITRNAWHHVTATYTLATRKVSLKIDAQVKVTSVAGSVTTTISGPANLFMGQGSASLPNIPVNKTAFDTVTLATT
jgi:hypothetical protein